MRKILIFIPALGLIGAGFLSVVGFGGALAVDAEAGRVIAEEACAACHGANGISVSDDIPNLAGQKAKYLTGQLKAFHDGTRKNALMNAVAEQLDATAIDNVVAHFAGLPASPGQATSSLFPSLAADKVNFPEDFKATYTRYTTISFPKRKQVRYYYASPEALAAAEGDGNAFPHSSLLLVEIFKAKLDGDGVPVNGEDGHFVADKLAAYSTMEKQAGWGEEVPEILRNGDWRYSVFSPDGKHKAGVNEAKCMACHKPLDAEDYVFSLDALKKQAAR